MKKLNTIQQELYGLITQSDGAFATGGQMLSNELVKSEGALSAAERVNLYHRSFFTRLFECFKAEYPCLEYALGRELFRAFSFEYLRSYPPSDYTLFKLAENFPRYLEESRPDSHLPLSEREEWPSFIVELAQLERAFSEVYVAEDDENAQRFFEFDFPVLEFYYKWRKGNEPDFPESKKQYVAIRRKNFVVEHRVMEEVEFISLSGH